MLDKNTLVRVTNRSYGSVGYTVADLGIRREYQPNETKEVTVEEMLKLSYLPGGRKMIERYLIIDNADLVNEILGEVEPEYFYTAEDVKELLLTGSLEQLEDCLDFADKGVIDLIKKMAVDLEINDVAKRNIIYEKTGFNVNSSIQINHESQEEDEETSNKQIKRRSTPIIKNKEASSTKRKANPPKYKVTSMGQ